MAEMIIEMIEKVLSFLGIAGGNLSLDALSAASTEAFPEALQKLEVLFLYPISLIACYGLAIGMIIAAIFMGIFGKLN